jgi:hypothetical protein
MIIQRGLSAIPEADMHQPELAECMVRRVMRFVSVLRSYCT